VKCNLSTPTEVCTSVSMASILDENCYKMFYLEIGLESE